MKKKVLITTLIGLVLLGAVVAAALNAVFTVTDIKVDYSVLSEQGKTESVRLQEELEEKFLGKSTTFLDLAEVTATAESFPAFRVESVEKDFPRTLLLTVSEKTEVLSFRRENGKYAVLDDEGKFLYDKEDNSNRRGGENVLLEGFSLTADVVGAQASGTYFPEALTFLSVFAETLQDVRANVLSVQFLPTENPVQGDGYFCLSMREGVIVNVYTPANQTREKAEAVLETYLALSDEQRLYGMFDVVDDLESGGFTVSRHREGTP